MRCEHVYLLLFGRACHIRKCQTLALIDGGSEHGLDRDDVGFYDFREITAAVTPVAQPDSLIFRNWP